MAKPLSVIKEFILEMDNPDNQRMSAKQKKSMKKMLKKMLILSEKIDELLK